MMKASQRLQKESSDLKHIRLWINDLTPFNFIPNALMKKIACGGIDITYDHKTQRYFYFPGKQIN